MQRQTLNVIHAVRSHRRFIISNEYVMHKDGFDWFKENEEYFHSIQDTGELKKNRADFNLIHKIPQNDIDRWDFMENEELAKEKNWIYY